MGNVAGDLLRRAQGFYDHIRHDPEVERLKRSLIVTARSETYDYVARIKDLAGFQKANPFNSRTIMANPRVRQEWQNGRLEGYEDIYIDRHPKGVGESHYDYRRLVDGLVMIDEKGSAYRKDYLDVIDDDDRPFTTLEKHQNRLNWRDIDKLLDEVQNDPTSPNGAML